MLNLTRLNILCEVIRYGSLSAAATELNYTQSAVSQQIATLEAEVGMTLLDRHPRGVRATAAGEALAQHARRIFTDVRLAEDELHAIAGLQAGRLRLACFPSAGSSLLPAVIARFASEHPEVRLSLIEGEPEQLAPRLLAGEVDLALMFAFADLEGPDWFQGSRIEEVALCQDPFHVVLGAEHRLAQAGPIGLDQLRGERWVQVSRESACARYVGRACQSLGFEPEIAFESDDYATVQGLVAAGVGVAVVPAIALSSQPGQRLRIRQLEDAPARTVSAALWSDGSSCPAAPVMLGMLREAFAEGIRIDPGSERAATVDPQA